MMSAVKATALLGALLIAASLFPSSQAQSPEQEVYLDDPEGDVMLIDGAQHPVDYIDFTGARFVVDQELIVEFEVAGTTALAAKDAPPITRAGFLAEVEFRGETFALHAFLTSSTQVDAYINRGSFMTGEVPAEWSGNTLTATVAFELLPSSSGFTPIGGDTIEVKRVASFFDFGQASNADQGFTPLYGSDSITVPPDSILRVPGSDGGLRLSSPQPVLRANGEETTYAWQVEVENLMDQPRTVVVKVAAGPEAQVHSPGAVDIPAGQAKVFTVYAIYPFAHQHGGTRDVEVTVADDIESASLDLQIFFIDPPQPAGHHARAFIHTDGSVNPNEFDDVWMNTLDEESGAPAGARAGNCLADNRLAFEWWIPLRPSLEVGIDARLGDFATVLLDVEQVSILPEVDLRARLALGENGSRPNVAYDDEATAVIPWPGQLGQTTSIEMQLPAPSEMDYVEPAPGRNLFLHVALCSMQPDPTGGLTTLAGIAAGAQVMLHGGYLELPFNDFLPRNAPLPTTIQVHVDDLFQRAPPGSQVTWEVHVEDAEVSALSPRGIEATLETRSGGAIVRTIVPEDAIHGATYELLLIAQRGVESTEVRLGVIVDRDAPFIAPETSTNSNHRTSTPGLMPLFGTLAGAIIIFQRKRGE